MQTISYEMRPRDDRRMRLPGEPQGTSGAGAGRDSMRDVGGRVLNRLASIEQNEATRRGYAEWRS